MPISRTNYDNGSMTFQMTPEDYKQLFAQDMLEHMPALLTVMEELLATSEKLISHTDGVKTPKGFKEAKEQIGAIKISIDTYKTKIEEATQQASQAKEEITAVPKTLEESNKELEDHVAAVEAQERAAMERRALKYN